MKTTGSRWKWLALVMGVCVATVIGMWVYALSLEEWGEARTMIFPSAASSPWSSASQHWFFSHPISGETADARC